MASSKTATASQRFVPIEQVRDGIVVLQDGSLRALLMASSINLALKSEDEQAAVLLQFQNFLNSLDFSVQFFIQSRELDIRPYLALLEDAYKQQDTELMKIQVREYIDFVRGFTEGSSIMSKNFFVVVPYNPLVVSGGGGMSALFGKGKNASDPGSSSERFDEYRSQLEQRVSVISQGLSRTGVRVAQLGTEEVIELFYKLFNMGELDRPMQMNAVTGQK